MSLHRLSFLYPHLCKCVRALAPSLPSCPLSLKRKRSSRSNFSTISQHQQETFPQRYGTAAEPQPPSNPTSGQSERSKTLADAIEKEVNAPGPQRQENRTSTSQTKDESTATQEPSDQVSSKPSKPPADEAAAASGSWPKATPTVISREALIKPIDRLSQLEVSTTPENGDNKPLHLQAPPYVHNFDTYTIVRDLKKGGFTHDQSVTLTKAVRSLLGANLDVARQGLMSKSDVENVSIKVFLSPLPCPHHLLSLVRNPTLSTPPPSNPANQFLHTLRALKIKGNLSLPRRLLRAPHRDPQRSDSQHQQNGHPARPSPARSRYLIPESLPGSPNPQRRFARHA